jgi:hypothetical protein
MNRNDALWVGLKVLGAYLLVHGAAEAIHALWWVPLTRPDDAIMRTLAWDRAWSIVVYGGVFIAAGLLLFLRTSLFVRVDGQTGDDRPPSRFGGGDASGPAER